MFLKFGGLKISTMSTPIPPQKSYSNVEFDGEVILDNIHATRETLTNSEILAISTEQTWDNTNTIFLSNFEDTLESGNITNTGLPITHWRIYRKETTDSLYTLLDEIAFSETSSEYIDYTPSNNIEYDYAVNPVSNSIEGNPITGVSTVSFNGWVLTDNDSITYNFDIEVNSENIRTIKALKVYENNTSYPVVSFSPTNYQTGSLTTIPGTLNDTSLDQSASYIETLRNFINNEQVKILKNSKGSMWKVATSDFEYKLMDKLIEQIATITFKWIQVGDVYTEAEVTGTSVDTVYDGGTF